MPADDRVLAAAVAQGATVFDVKGELYAASWFDVGWWVWKLEEGSTEHFVNSDFLRCTCKQFAKFESCKHVKALKERFS